MDDVFEIVPESKGVYKWKLGIKKNYIQKSVIYISVLSINGLI